jgi:hypothetical protein
VTRTKLVVALLLAVLGFYLWSLLDRLAAVVSDGGWVGWALAFGMVVLVVAGAGVAVAEVRFGMATQRLGRVLDDEGTLPEDVPRLPTGGRDRAATDAVFERYRAEAEAAPDSWRAWFRLALAYDMAGDRKRARAAARHALRLHRAQP